MSDSFEWDVFLSHSNADKPRVKRLADRIAKAGFRVWFDGNSIAAGDDIVAAIERGLERTRVLVLCMTTSAFQSDWVQTERNSRLFLDPANRERRFLPLYMEDCAIPALLRRLAYIDWRNESEEAWEKLLAMLQPGAAPLPNLPATDVNPFDPVWSNYLNSPFYR
jgi:hypothetical protein